MKYLLMSVQHAVILGTLYVLIYCTYIVALLKRVFLTFAHLHALSEAKLGREITKDEKMPTVKKKSISMEKVRSKV